jgi:hypothetical protein
LLVWGILQWFSKPAAEYDRLERVASQLMTYAIDNLLVSPESSNGTTEKITRQLVSQPGKTLQTIRDVHQSGNLNQLFNDPDLQKLMSEGNSDALAQTDALKALAQNEQLVGLMQDSQLISDTAMLGEVEQKLSSTVVDVWQKMESVKQSDDFQEILHDPEFKSMMEGGNQFAILASDKFHRLAKLILSAEPSQRTSREVINAASEAVSGNGDKPTGIYKWRDEHGQLHYSDEKPPAGAVILEQP